MLTLWYIILGWKEYNKPFRKVEEPPKPIEPAKKPDLIPHKKDGPTTKPADVKTPDPTPKPPPPRTFEPPAFNNKPPEPPKVPETKITFPTPDTPKTPSSPKFPEPKISFPSPDTAKTPSTPKLPEPAKPSPKAPETPKTPDASKTTPRTPETPKLADFRLAPEPPKKPDTPKTPQLPDLPSPGKTTPNQSEFPIPPYLSGPPQNKPLNRDDELFAMGNPFANPAPNRPPTDLRDLSYAKGEFPGDEALGSRVKETVARIPKYMEQSVISNPDSLESDEDDVEF